MHTLILSDQEASQPVADLIMSQRFAACQSRFTTLDSFNKAVFLLKIARDYIPQRLIGTQALACRALSEPGFDIGSELDFHSNSVGGIWVPGNVADVRRSPAQPR